MVTPILFASCCNALALITCVVPEANETFLTVARFVALIATAVFTIVASDKEDKLNDRIKAIENKHNAKEG